MPKHCCRRALLLAAALALLETGRAPGHEPDEHDRGPGIQVWQHLNDPPKLRKLKSGPPEWGEDGDGEAHATPFQKGGPLKEAGAARFAVTAATAEARGFIGRGVYHLHCCDRREAERCFRQAAVLDPHCAMAYWGMALANLDDEKLARRYLDAALLCKRRTIRETMYLSALGDFLKAGPTRDRERRIAYARALERIAITYAEDMEARVFLALELWRNERHGIPLSSRLAVDSLLREVLAVHPPHPCHHHRILLWSTEQPELALDSAAKCGRLDAGHGHLWHMAARVYAPLGRYVEAAWHQEACARAQHAYALRDGLLPDQVPGYARNRAWLARMLARLGRPRDAIAIAKDLLDLPRHPRWNSADHPGSTCHGRSCLREILSEYELWEELIDLGKKIDWQGEEGSGEHTRWLLALGRAHFHIGIEQRQPEQVSAGRALQAGLEKRAWAKPGRAEAEALAAAVKELQGLNALAAGQTEKALTLLKQANTVDPLFLAWAHVQAGKPDEAENLILREIEERPEEVLPRAQLVSLRWQAGRKGEAESAFPQLRKVAGRADLQAPVLARLAPLAEQWGFPRDWRIPPRRAAAGEQPSLSSLGPPRWKPTMAPDWTLADARGRKWSLQQMRGKPVLLIFYLGAGCLHCVEQMKAFAPRARDFKEAGITVIGISTEDAPTLQMP